MTLPLPVDGRKLSPDQRQALMSRKHKGIIVPIGDLDCTWMENFTCNLHILIDEVVQLMLSGDPLDYEFVNAVSRSSTHPDELKAWLEHGLNRLCEPMTYAMQLYHRLDDAWQQTRFSNPDISVYGARFDRYVGDAIVIEVMYRDIPPRI